ncbi:hypothetical protein PR048_032409 [Dryococelus australis]|uniref:mannose-6-phosphate isomerase n=1 Tax=Dryococelus australis TaxID=614101 RepID=A0ABQ9G242_9NEOP|nr:hypothetical protein PR048_032409 [Dryococelus australis]
MQLLCAVQKYSWGKLGSASLVAQLGQASNPQFEVCEESPYAELWMGTHPNGPSVNKATGEALFDWLQQNPSSLGTRVREVFGENLPFLFKVLSVRQALSVQAHPSKSHAEELHRLRPDLYKDPNHKPELAVALTPFQAMCDFRPAEEIRGFLQSNYFHFLCLLQCLGYNSFIVPYPFYVKYATTWAIARMEPLAVVIYYLLWHRVAVWLHQLFTKDELDRWVRALQARPKSIAQLMEWLQEEWRRITVDVLETLLESMPDRLAAVIAARGVGELRAIVGEDTACRFVTCDEANQQSALKACFCALIAAPSDLVASQLTQLVERVAALGEADRAHVLAPLLEELHSQFPGDVGCFVMYFLNVITLQPGQALFLAPNQPHAYLSGDCVECMACSDNVVRAGLTPKYKDVDTLCEMLVYHCQPAEDKLFVPTREDSCTQVFLPPVPDFAVAHINVAPPLKQHSLRPRSTASILLVVRGTGSTSDPELQLAPGTVIFLPAGAKMSVSRSSDAALDMYQAFANV